MRRWGGRGSPMASWGDRVAAAHEYLVRRGHVDPVVAVGTREGRYCAGDAGQRWEIGSVTKVFTSLLLAELATNGEVGLTDRVVDHVPPGTPLADGVGEITLEHLACHRSGLPRLPPGVMARSFSRRAMTDPYADFDEERLLAGLAHTRVRGRPGRARMRYSNYGAGLLGFLLGRATGLGYEASLTQRVLQPLGLQATSFADDGLHQGRYHRTPVGPWHLAALAGAGGLRSTAEDLLTFLAMVRDGTGPLAGAIGETLSPRIDGGRAKVGLGWFMLGDGDMLLHDGGTLGARSEVRIERHTSATIVVLGDGRGGTGRVAAMLLDPR